MKPYWFWSTGLAITACNLLAKTLHKILTEKLIKEIGLKSLGDWGAAFL